MYNTIAHNTSKSKKSRDLNFELLRILSIISIVTGHLSSIGPSIINPLTVLGDVNCFILISGYFMIDGQYKTYRILRLAVETIFYCFSISLLFYIFTPNLSIGILIKSLIPFGPHAYSYWFINKFIGLLLLQPFLSKLATLLSKRQYQYLLLILLAINSELIFGFPFASIFNNGWSLSWFITLFYIGGYVRKYNPFNGFQWWGATYIITVIVLLIISSYNFKYINIQYNNWFFFAKSFSIFMWIHTLNIPYDSIIGKIVNFFAPNILAVYLIHNQQLILNWLIYLGSTVYIQQVELHLVYWCMFSCIIIILCTLIDKSRMFLFNFFGISTQIASISLKFDNKIRI